MVKRIAYMRLNVVGWIGAALFVLPVPAIGWLALRHGQMTPGQAMYRRTLAEVSGRPADALGDPAAPGWVYIALLTAMLVGLVMLMAGREIMVDDKRP
jgi:hypothetical protein